MTQNLGCSEEVISTREFIKANPAHDINNDGDFLTYQRRVQTSGNKRKSCGNNPPSKLNREGNESETDQEELDLMCKKHEVFYDSTAHQPKKPWFEIWKSSCRSIRLKSNMGSKKTVALKPKRVTGQYFLDLGQKDFSYSTCPVCGLFYARGLENDEIVHRVFHKNRTQGIQFNGWQKERVVSKLDDKGNRVIIVLPEDTHHQHKVKEVIDVVEVELGLSPGWLNQTACKVYLFISSSKKVVGCLMAEPIKHAFRVLPSKKQDVGDKQVNSGVDRWSSLRTGELRGGTEATILNEIQNQSDASVSDRSTPGRDVGEVNPTKVVELHGVPNVCLQPVTQLSAQCSSSTLTSCHTSEASSVCGEDIQNFTRETNFVGTKARMWKLTDFYQQLRTSAAVGTDNAPTTSDSSPCLNSVPRIHTHANKEKTLGVGSCGWNKPSRISDYFTSTRNTCILPEGSDNLEENCQKAGATGNAASDEAQEVKEHGVSGEQKIKLEKVTEIRKLCSDPAGQGQVEKWGNHVSSDLELVDTMHFNFKPLKAHVDRCLQETRLEHRVSTSEHCVSSTTFLQPKIEVKEEASLHRPPAHAILDQSHTSNSSHRKGGVQICMKDEVLLKTELDAEEELPGRESDDISAKKSVQKKPCVQVRSGANVLQQFGNVKLCREVLPRKRSRQEHAQELGSSAIVYNTTPFSAVCGARVIWVSKSERRKGIASHLLDAMRKTFCLGVVLEPSQFAFSQPTTDGRKFAQRYCKTDEFLVYTS
ncbi:N-acetyltransferase [Marchantia polymorpha subsp. ruderalis]|uniref:N-acetyltransferase ESCO acetyl-transferase domain-containing protein n=2 Tax=Marchantia polymorpha TaxID=3197 RepID=A0AAF6AQN7_MARPO|nr:hypothetical protein MARPO_0033s0057 [Marchantia polymorpha]PTQ41647.1 hypothetical protein MARPO_0033s0057 [Marchantia polymorpha]BBM98757.1 hypothetical protein Mp_1g16030 [Marchantia polymorpha subsp. ruderalis]BBM98758.1 hypothetical protein Mp_1g16030 [Marchantia polymorpha subsp. ruderalis]|eukprot:PTQ41646.1 hypothetical protein MARPO_0033s0057 [Marchantia polymorpha]